MNEGFSIVELLIVLTISFTIFGMVISNITEGMAVTEKITSKQQLLESLFFTVDTIKNDLTKCGMRLQDAKKIFNLTLFSNTDSSFRITYGLASDELKKNCYIGDEVVEVVNRNFVKKGRKILIYDPDSRQSEIARVKKTENFNILLDSPLKKEHLKHSIVIPLKEIEWKLYKRGKTLKRKIDKGYFQPVIEGVTSFYVSYFKESNSVLYKLEINNREQVRGYIFLSNMTEQ